MESMTAKKKRPVTIVRGGSSFFLGVLYFFVSRNVPMKTERTFTVVIERDDEGHYVASVPALPGCHTQAKNLDTLMERVREVIELCLEDGEEPASLELVGIQQISV
jgi:predicted RNase H-like HicB family nuclease